MRNSSGGDISNKAMRVRIIFFCCTSAVVTYLFTMSTFLFHDKMDLVQREMMMMLVPQHNLAYEQSFGFFDDIPNDNWRRMQMIAARTFPNHFGRLSKFSSGPNDRGDYDKLKKSSYWNGENFQEEFHCAYAERVPSSSQADGPKWVCDPHRIGRRGSDCLIYSVGSNGKTEFEEGALEQIGRHCEIHTFDLNRYNKRNGDFGENMRPFGTFHHWGIGTQEEADRYKATKRGPVMKTLAETKAELGHTNHTIDVFKIDCEWCEWFTYKEWLNHDLRQILVETHNAPMPNAQDFFYSLHDAGYVIFSKEANYQNGAGGVEFGFLKLSTDFFINGTMYKNLPDSKESKV